MTARAASIRPPEIAWDTLVDDGPGVFGVACTATIEGRAAWMPLDAEASAVNRVYAWTAEWAAPEYGIHALHATIYVRELATGGGFAALQLVPRGETGGPVAGRPPVKASASDVADALEIVAQGGIEPLLRSIWHGPH